MDAHHSLLQHPPHTSPLRPKPANYGHTVYITAQRRFEVGLRGRRRMFHFWLRPLQLRLNLSANFARLSMQDKNIYNKKKKGGCWRGRDGRGGKGRQVAEASASVA